MKPIHLFLGLTLLISLSCSADRVRDLSQTISRQSQSSPTTENRASINSTPPVIEAISAKLQSEVDDNIRSGFVSMIVHEGKIIHAGVNGKANIAQDIPMTLETRFRIASMTKPITSVSILMLMEEGKLHLDDKMADYIPAFTNLQVATNYSIGAEGKIETTSLTTPMTIRHLLTHTAGLGYLFDSQTDLGKLYLQNHLYRLDGDLKARINHLATLPLYNQPGHIWQYSYATDVLGRIIEVVTKDTLETFMRERIFIPLGMSNTEFLIDTSDLKNMATVYAHDKDQNIVAFEGDGLTPNPNTSGTGWYSGGVGLISTAHDYMQFLQMLINDGTLNGQKILSPESIKLIMEPHVALEKLPPDWAERGRNFGLAGWVVTQSGLAHEYSAPGQFGWGGYYDTNFAIDIPRKLAFLVLAQREPGRYDRPSNAEVIVRNAAFKAMAP